MNYTQKMEAIRKLIVHPLTLAEKILYTHNWEKQKKLQKRNFLRRFSPDRWHADAIAQMALAIYASFKSKVAVPSTAHADHLIQAN